MSWDRRWDGGGHFVKAGRTHTRMPPDLGPKMQIPVYTTLSLLIRVVSPKDSRIVWGDPPPPAHNHPPSVV